jgi:hypothetical protein
MSVKMQLMCIVIMVAAHRSDWQIVRETASHIAHVQHHRSSHADADASQTDDCDRRDSHVRESEWLAEVGVMALVNGGWNSVRDEISVILKLGKFEDDFEKNSEKLAVEILAWRHEWKMVTELVNSVSDSQLQRECFSVAIETATRNDRLRSEKLVKDSDSDEMVRDKFCRVVGEAAAQSGQWELVKELVDTISNSEIKDQLCRVAGESASLQHKWHVVESLVSSVTDHDIRLHICKAAITAAAQSGKSSVVTSLLKSLSHHHLTSHDSAASAISPCSPHQMPENAESLHHSITQTQPQLNFQFIDITDSALFRLLASDAVNGNNTNLKLICSHFCSQSNIHAALLKSISDGDVSLAISLLPFVDDIDCQDSSGASVLMLAADHGHDELIHAILSRIASVNLKDNLGDTALSRACCAGHVRSVKALVDGGADLGHRDGENRSCVQLASERGKTEVEEFLRFLLNP